jgi:hypothetical protein
LQLEDEGGLEVFLSERSSQGRVNEVVYNRVVEARDEALVLGNELVYGQQKSNAM